jgi:hypothetical protein
MLAERADQSGPSYGFQLRWFPMFSSGLLFHSIALHLIFRKLSPTVCTAMNANTPRSALMGENPTGME